MISRISDPRVADPDPALAVIVDLLRPCSTLSDLTFMFDAVTPVSAATYRLRVDPGRALLFEWVEDFGAVNIRLE